MENNKTSESKEEWYAENGTVYNRKDDNAKVCILFNSGGYMSMKQEQAYEIANILNRQSLSSTTVKEEESQIFVFELSGGKLTNISVGFDTIEDAQSFIDTMKEGMYYKSINTTAKLIPMAAVQSNTSSSELLYWKKKCELLEAIEAVNPCDPDITSEQIEAYKNLREFNASHELY